MKRVPFHGYFTSSDASGLTEAQSRFTLYPYGSSTGITLGSGDIVDIDSITIANGATAITVTVYDGADASVGNGELILTLTAAAKALLTEANKPYLHSCQAGTYPKVKTGASGQIDVTITGYVRTFYT